MSIAEGWPRQKGRTSPSPAPAQRNKPGQAAGPTSPGWPKGEIRLGSSPSFADVSAPKKFKKNPKKFEKNSEIFFKKIPKMYVFFPYKYLTILSTFNTKSSYNFFSIQYFLLSTHIIHFPHQISIQTHLLPIFFTLYSYFPLSTPIPYKLFSFQYFLLSTHIFVLLSICRK